jgi:hypothetical protein
LIQFSWFAKAKKKNKRKVRQYNKTKRPCDVGVWGKTKERGKKKRKRKQRRIIGVGLDCIM